MEINVTKSYRVYRDIKSVMFNRLQEFRNLSVAEYYKEQNKYEILSVAYHIEVRDIDMRIDEKIIECSTEEEAKKKVSIIISMMASKYIN